jgi:hypothetical protein
MKKFVIGLAVIIVLAAAGLAGWYYFIKKSPEGGKCTNSSRCQTGLKCVDGFCSSGKVNSPCKTYNDCESGLLCLKNKCSQKPDYSKYFDKIMVSKIKPDMGPGPNNPQIITTEFTTGTDAIEVDLVGVKPSTTGQFYFELVNTITGEVALSTQNRQGPTPVNGRDIGSATDLFGVIPGTYDLNFYFNNELLYTSPISVK